MEIEFYPKVRKLQLSLLVIKLLKIIQSKITMGKITQHEITQGNLLMNMNVKCHRVRVKVTKPLEKSYDFTKIYPSPIFLHGHHPQRPRLFACLLQRALGGPSGPT